MSSGSSSLPNVRGSMQEVLFAQRLADNEKKVRDRALRKLRVYLNLKSSHGPGLTDDDALKIWKGLFYCMYMADKPLVQEDVAEEISYLIHDLVNPKDRYTFTSAAFRTFAREWNGIDIFRMDKFMMFLRRVLRQVFVYLKLQQWSIKEVVRYMNILDADVIRADDHTNVTPLGIKLHLCGIIMEELAKIGGEELDNKVILAVIKPFMKVLAVSKLDVYRNAVAEDIIRHLMRQTELGVEEEDDIEGIMKGKVIKKDRMAMVSDNAVDDDAITADDDDDEDDVEMEERTLEDAVLDPRAGSVSVFIPQLKPDFELIATALQNVGSLKKVSKMNRQLLYKLVDECRDMAGQVYPLALPEDLLDDDDDEEEDEEEEEEKAVERLQEFYSKLTEVSTTDIREMEDLKVDPLKNFSIEKSLSDRKRHKKKSKLKRLKKKKIPLTKKLALSKQEAAAEANRAKAVERKLGHLAQEVGVPIIKNMPMKKKSTEMPSSTTKSLKRKKSSEANMGKVPKKNKKTKSSGFEVSAITPDSGEVKSKFSSSSGFEVTPICSKAESGHEQKNTIPKSGEISEKMKVVCQSEMPLISDKPEVLVSDLPKKIKRKKKKVKAGARKEHLPDISKLGTNDSLKKEKDPISKQSEKPVSACAETGGQTLNLSKESVSVVCNGSFPNVNESQKNEPVGAVAVKEKSEDKIEGVFSIEASKSGVQSHKKSGKAKNKKPKVKVNLESSELNMIAKVPNKENMKETENPVSSPVNAVNNATFGKSPKKTPSKVKGLTMNFSGDENLSFGKKSMKEDIEIFIKNRRQMKLEKRKSDAALNSPKGTPKTSKSKERTIKINLKQNQEHDFKDYAHSVRNSPQIPYSADKVPKAPVLKPSPSPILVGRPGLKILKNLMRKSPSAKSASPMLKNKSPRARKMKRSKAADFF